MAEILFQDLNFRINPVSNLERMYELSDNFHRTGIYNVTSRIYNIPNEEIINPEFVNLIHSLDLKLKSTFEVFQTPPNSISVIHSDNPQYKTGVPGDITKLNFVFGGNGSKMGWYKEKNGITNTCDDILKRPRPLRYPHMSYYQDECELIAEHTIAFPTLVQVGPPHNIWTDNESRYCLCFIPTWNNGNRLTMKESLKKFEKFIV